jgi:hypothetical protein
MAKKFNIDAGTIVAIGAGVAVIWGLTGLKKLLNSLGITESADTKAADEIASDTTSPWNPIMYQKAPSGSKLLTNQQCENLYNAIDSSWGYFDDDEEKIIGSIKAVIRYQVQWSFFSWWMANKKGIDLLDYMRGGAYWGRLEDSDINEITKYIESLPKYK